MLYVTVIEFQAFSTAALVHRPVLVTALKCVWSLFSGK